MDTIEKRAMLQQWLQKSEGSKVHTLCAWLTAQNCDRPDLRNTALTWEELYNRLGVAMSVGFLPFQLAGASEVEGSRWLNEFGKGFRAALENTQSEDQFVSGESSRWNVEQIDEKGMRWGWQAAHKLYDLQ